MIEQINESNVKLSTPSLTLRQAKREDIAKLETLIIQSMRHLGRQDYDVQQIEDGLEHVFKVDPQLIDDGTYYVVEAGDQLVGAGGWSRRLTFFSGDYESLVSHQDDYLDPQKDPAKIRAFYVHPNWARQGIARRLIQTCEAAAKDAKFSKTELVATLTGEPLYLKCGYQMIERLEVELPNGRRLSAAKMAKSLR